MVSEVRFGHGCAGCVVVLCDIQGALALNQNGRTYIVTDIHPSLTWNRIEQSRAILAAAAGEAAIARVAIVGVRRILLAIHNLNYFKGNF